MKRLVLVLLALSPVCSLAVAQVRPAIRAGAHSLNFTFGGFGGFGLGGTGPAGGVGVSHFLSADAALRVGLQARSHSRTLSWNSPGGVAGSDGKESGFNLGAAVDYLKYMGVATSRVRPYLGGGVGVMMISNKATPAAATGTTPTETKNNPGGITTGGFASPGMTLDLHGNFGVEFFLFNEISVAGEYALNVVNRTSPTDREDITGATTVTTKGNPTTNILGFGAAGATVRIYF